MGSPILCGVNYISSKVSKNDLSEQFFKHSAERPIHKELGGGPYSPLISIMTADFLLTAQDISGWQGDFGKINYENLIEQALLELCDGLMDESKITRELQNIQRIADHLGLMHIYRKHLKALKRNKRRALEGDALSPRQLYLNANRLNIRDAYQASQYIKIQDLFLKRGIKDIPCLLINSVILYFREIKSRKLLSGTNNSAYLANRYQILMHSYRYNYRPKSNFISNMCIFYKCIVDCVLC